MSRDALFKEIIKDFARHYGKKFPSSDRECLGQWIDTIRAMDASDDTILQASKTIVQSKPFFNFPPSPGQFEIYCKSINKGGLRTEIVKAINLIRTSFHRTEMFNDDEVLNTWEAEFASLNLDLSQINRAAINLIRIPTSHSLQPPSFGELYNECLRLSVSDDLPMFYECFTSTAGQMMDDQIIRRAHGEHAKMGLSGRVDRISAEAFSHCYQKSLIAGYSEEFIEEKLVSDEELDKAIGAIDSILDKW